MESDVVSTFFSNNDHANPISSNDKISDDFLHIIDELNISLEQIRLPSKVECVYNPTIYARHTFEMYVRKFCNSKKSIMFLGMNPGPWGMSQTGVPFGVISHVRDWLGIEGPVGKPPREIAARPVKGFYCKNTEASGVKFWGLFKELCGTPEKFFETSFVYNYLPQQWMKNNGCNVTPGEISTSQLEKLFNICDQAFIKVLELYEVKTIVAVGRFCETRAQKAIQKYKSESSIQVVYLQHPSPRIPNNTNWKEKAFEELKKYNLLQFYRSQDTMPT